jgi:hypothetical protein
VSNKVPFDKEKFLNSCACGCTKSRQAILDGIEKYRESDPDMVKYLEWYRDDLWNKEVKKQEYNQLTSSFTDEQLKKHTATTLRAMADKVEQGGMHFMIDCELPQLPIFSGNDAVERYYSHISVTLVAGPLGG